MNAFTVFLTRCTFAGGVAAVILLTSLPTQLRAQGLFQQFMAAYHSKNYAECAAAGRQLTTRINHPDLLIQLAECQCALNNNSEAINTLNKLTGMGIGIPFDTMKVFANLAKDTQALKNLVRPPVPPAFSCSTHYQIADTLFIPEGIAFVAGEKMFYVGSLTRNKIISVDKKGHAADFFVPKNSNWQFTGLKASGDDLWACAFSEHGTNKGHSSIFQINRKSGSVKKQFVIEQGEHLFNDLVKTIQGDLIVTDSKTGYLYRLRDQKFTPIADSVSFIYPNGIAYDPGKQRLFVAHWMGISMIDLTTEKVENLDSDFSLHSIDGLSWYNGSLIGVQNLSHISRVVKINIDPQRKVSEVVELYRETARGKPGGIPTTGALARDKFYFISNSFVRNAEGEGSVRNNEQVTPAQIKQISLR
ncbi:MAG TPA: hypothetical protein VGD40_02425 [Chryseosolibacter sp.]